MQTLTVLDISPTLKMYQSTNMQFAKAYYHWFFLIQEAPLPEQMLEGHGPRYILTRLGSGLKTQRFDRRALAEYTRCFGSAHDMRRARTTARPRPSISCTTGRISKRNCRCRCSRSGAGKG